MRIPLAFLAVILPMLGGPGTLAGAPPGEHRAAQDQAGPGDERARQLEQAYGFGRDSSYDELLAALNRIQNELRRGTDAARVIEARDLALGYVPSERAIQFRYDFFLQQPEYELKVNGTDAIAELLQAGVVIDTELKKRIADKLSADLAAVAALKARSLSSDELVSSATEALVLLGDMRGLDVFLTDSVGIEELQASDGWSHEDDWKFFHLLSRGYRERGSPDPLLASVYTLLAERRRVHGRIEALHPVMNIDAFRALPAAPEQQP